MNTVIKRIQILGEKFVIVRNEDGWYLAINTKYIDEDGKLNKPLNGLQMHANKDLKQCVQTTITCVEFKALTDAGFTVEEAIKKCCIANS